MGSVSVDTDSYQRGPTSRLVAEAEIQTSGNTKASLLDYYYLLHYVHCLFSDKDFLEVSYSNNVYYDSYLAVSSNIGLLLHEDFLHPPSSSKSAARPCSTTEPNKSTEHSAIQKSSVQFTVAAIHVSRLLSAIFFGIFVHSFDAILIIFSRLELRVNFSWLKLVIKPDSLLLEDRRSEASSEGYNQTSTLLLLI